jgi:hypothetical protein
MKAKKQTRKTAKKQNAKTEQKKKCKLQKTWHPSNYLIEPHPELGIPECDFAW